MKLLIIRFSSIGDIVLTTPVIRCIKQQKENVEIHYLTKLSFKTIVATNPHIDSVHYLGEDIKPLITTLKAEKFDYIIDLHHNLRTARIKKALEVTSWSFPKLNVEKWLLVNTRLNLMPDKSIVERYFETVKHLDVKNDGKGLDYFIPKEDETDTDDVPMSHWAGYAGFVIGGSYKTKKFPVEKWKELCAATNYPIILLGGKEDMDEGDLIAATDPVKIYNACGKFNLNESADLVRKARVIVSNDTGLMHIAAAFQKTVISLWGNTSPEMGMYPYYGFNNLKSRIAPNSFIIENKSLYCHPCSKLGFNECPKGHFRCMKELKTEDIVKYIEKNWLLPQLKC